MCSKHFSHIIRYVLIIKKEPMKTLLTLLALLLSFGVTYADYDRLRESLEPVSNCQWVTGSIVHEAVYINLWCPEHDENGWMVNVKKSIYIDLIAKTRKRTNGWFELLD